MKIIATVAFVPLLAFGNDVLIENARFRLTCGDGRFTAALGGGALVELACCRMEVQ